MRTKTIASALLSFALPMLGGCLASLTAYPEISYDPRGELKSMQAYLSPDAITEYESEQAGARNGMDQETWRNAVINARVRAMDILFNEFQQDLYREGVGSGITTDWIVLALGGAGSLISSASTALSAASSGVVGAKAAFDRNAFHDKTLTTLLATMVAQRKDVLATIRANQVRDVVAYPLTLALTDLDRYYQAGTLPGALLAVAENAGSVASDADVRLKSLLVVTAVPESLQSRREEAAEFIKRNLDGNQMRTLAKALGIPPEPADDAMLTELLLRISGAESDEEFEIISQSLSIHFNQEF